MTTDTVEKTQTEVKLSPLYQVIIHNDDKTTYECVIEVLIKVFKKLPQEAVELTIKVDQEGAALAGVYTKEVAQDKVERGKNIARSYGFPLQITSEPQ